MWLIAELPVTVRTGRGDVKLTPGIPQELPDAIGQRVLERAGEKVRIHEPNGKEETLIEPASPTAKPIYWESVDGKILGPAKPEFLAKSGPDGHEQFWIVVTFRKITRWISSDRLRRAPSGTKG